MTDNRRLGQCTTIRGAGLHGSFDQVVAPNSEVLGSNPDGSNTCLRDMHIQCSKLFQGPESAVLSMAPCAINNP